MNDRDWIDIDVSEEAEDAMAWLQGIGGGAAAGAATGAVAGPWGALIGGAVGAGLGALSTHQQQQAQAQTSRTAQRQRATGGARPTPRQAGAASAPQPARTTASAPQRTAPAPNTSAGVTGAVDVLNELQTLMPALRQLAAGLVAGAAPPAPSGAAAPAEFRAPRPAWEVAEDVAVAMRDVPQDPTDTATGHVHPVPHPAARDSGTPGHPLHVLHQTVSRIASQVRQS